MQNDRMDIRPPESEIIPCRKSGGTAREVGSASAYGTREGPGGACEVTAARPGAPIRVRRDTGEADVAYVHHLGGGRITEVKYGKPLFGMGLCE